MLNPLYSSLSPESLGNSVNGLFSVFPVLPVAANIYSSIGLFPGLDTVSTNPVIGTNIQANPGGNVQTPESDSPGLSIYPYGLAGLFNPVLSSGFPYSGLNYLTMVYR